MYVHLDGTVQLAKIVQVHEMTVDIFAIEDAVVIKEVPKGMLRQCPKRAGEDTLGGNTLGDCKDSETLRFGDPVTKT